MQQKKNYIHHTALTFVYAHIYIYIIIICNYSPYIKRHTHIECAAWPTAPILPHDDIHEWMSAALKDYTYGHSENDTISARSRCADKTIANKKKIPMIQTDT